MSEQQMVTVPLDVLNRLQQSAGTLLTKIDFTAGMCNFSDPVGVVLDVNVLHELRDAYVAMHPVLSGVTQNVT